MAEFGLDGHVEKTVLFADIAGSTRLYGRFGDDATQRLLSDCLDLMESIVREHKGQVARRIGDEILCTFARADDAAMAAMALQSRVSDGDVNGLFPTPMRIRVGFEHGAIIEAPDALYGNVVHTAARVASLAKAGQILTSAATIPHLGPALQCFTRYVDSVVLKGQSGEQEIHEIVWNVQQATVARRPGKAPPARPAVSTAFVDLEYAGHVCRADESQPRLELGRDHSCDLRVSGEAVSKLHARVLWDRNGAQIEDVSTNGTFIVQADASTTELHHTRAPLRGEGILHLGDAQDFARGAAIRFRCGKSA